MEISKILYIINVFRNIDIEYFNFQLGQLDLLRLRRQLSAWKDGTDVNWHLWQYFLCVFFDSIGVHLPCENKWDPSVFGL